MISWTSWRGRSAFLPKMTAGVAVCGGSATKQSQDEGAGSHPAILNRAEGMGHQRGRHPLVSVLDVSPGSLWGW